MRLSQLSSPPCIASSHDSLVVVVTTPAPYDPLLGFYRGLSLYLGVCVCCPRLAQSSRLVWSSLVPSRLDFAFRSNILYSPCSPFASIRQGLLTHSNELLSPHATFRATTPTIALNRGDLAQLSSSLAFTYVNAFLSPT